MLLTEETGDIFEILETKADIMCHQVNCMGKMGRGLAAQVKTKYPFVFSEYQNFCKIRTAVDILGCCFVAPTKRDSHKFVANIFGQYSYGTAGVMTDYDALRRAFKGLATQLYVLAVSKYGDNPAQTLNNPIVIAIPNSIGAGLAGGDQEKIWGIIVNELSNLNYIHVIKVKERSVFSA